MIARFPGICAICQQPIERGSELVDSGLRGPKGGKKMAHVGCVSTAVQNGVNWTRAFNNPMMIPSKWPPSQYAPKPLLAGGSTYYPYSYEQFARDNPKPKKGTARKNTILLPKPNYYEVPKDAGPYKPDMFPLFGSFGHPAAYDIPGTPPIPSLLPTPVIIVNPRRQKARKNSKTGSQKRADAKLILQHMVRGLGNTAEYPGRTRRLAQVCSPEDELNRDLWTMYLRAKPQIEQMTGVRMPDMRELRRL